MFFVIQEPKTNYDSSEFTKWFERSARQAFRRGMAKSFFQIVLFVAF